MRKYGQICKIRYLGRVIECTKYGAISLKRSTLHILNFQKRVFSWNTLQCTATSHISYSMSVSSIILLPLMGVSSVDGPQYCKLFININSLFKLQSLRIKMSFCFNLSSFCTFFILWRGGSVSHCNLLTCFSLVKITLYSRKGKLTSKVIIRIRLLQLPISGNWITMWHLHSMMGGFV